MPPPRAFASLGCFVVPDFLGRETREAIVSAARAAAGAEAAVEDADALRVRREIRSVDEVDGADAYVRDCDARLEALRPALERHFDVALGAAEPAGLLRYATGGFYRPHRDRSSGTPGTRDRAVSVVVFVNGREGGSRYEGGALRIYGLLGEGPLAEVGLDMEPDAGTLVAFRSEWQHEVTPVTSGQRFTIVTWFPREPGARR